MKTNMTNSVALPLDSQTKNLESSARSIKWEVLSRHRSRPHLERKFYHFVMGMVCFSLYAFALNRTGALILLGVIGGPLVALDLLRFKYPRMNELVLLLFGKIMRREELKSVSGNSFYVMGLFVVVALFPKTIVLLSVLYLAIGDPIAAVIGSQFGKHRLIGKKSVEGAFANWICSSVASGIFASAYLGYSLERSLFVALVGGVISVCAELFPAPIDDNFTIPVLSGILLSLSASVLPLF